MRTIVQKLLRYLFMLPIIKKKKKERSRCNTVLTLKIGNLREAGRFEHKWKDV